MLEPQYGRRTLNSLHRDDDDDDDSEEFCAPLTSFSNYYDKDDSSVRSSSSARRRSYSNYYDKDDSSVRSSSSDRRRSFSNCYDKDDSSVRSSSSDRRRPPSRTQSGPMTAYRRRAPSPKRSNLKKSNSNNFDERQRLAARERQRRRSNNGPSNDANTIEVHIRGQRKPVVRTRSVEFNTRVKVQKVAPLTEMAKPNEIWIQEGEMAKLKERRKQDVRQYMKQLQTAEDLHTDRFDAMSRRRCGGNHRPSASLDDSLTCFRGLEKFADKTVKNRKMDGWDAVLLEQAEQVVNGEFDEEQIAQSYRRTTSASFLSARQRAKQDASDIESYLMSPRTQKLVLGPRRKSMG